MVDISSRFKRIEFWVQLGLACVGILVAFLQDPDAFEEIVTVLFFLQVISAIFHVFVKPVYRVGPLRIILAVAGTLLGAMGYQLLYGGGNYGIGTGIMYLLVVFLWQILIIIVTGIEIRYCREVEKGSIQVVPDDDGPLIP